MLILPPYNLTSWVLRILKRGLFPSPISLPLFCFLKLKMLKALSLLLYLMSQCNKVLFTYHQKKEHHWKVGRERERESEQFIGLKVLQGMLMLCSSEFLVYIYIYIYNPLLIFLVFKIKKSFSPYISAPWQTTVESFQYYGFLSMQALLIGQGFECVQRSGYHILLGNLVEIFFIEHAPC